MEAPPAVKPTRPGAGRTTPRPGGGRPTGSVELLEVLAVGTEVGVGAADTGEVTVDVTGEVTTCITDVVTINGGGAKLGTGRGGPNRVGSRVGKTG